MNRLRMGQLGAVAFLVASATLAQEIGWLDLTDLHPRERIRTPHAASGECGGGGGFEPTLSANITLTYLDKTSYSLGQEVTYEVKIQNTGKEPIEIPWTPHLGDLEPADSSQSYTYLDAAVSLDFTGPISNRRFSIYANSYGASNVAGTTRKLLPGESALVRARQKLDIYEEWWQSKIVESSPLNVKVSANLMLNKVTYSPGEKSDAAIDQSVCIPFAHNTWCAARCSLVASEVKMKRRSNDAQIGEVGSALMEGVDENISRQLFASVNSRCHR